jgi:hypothetical protein
MVPIWFFLPENVRIREGVGKDMVILTGGKRYALFEYKC